MHSFEAVRWSSSSRFEHCAMHSAIRSPKFTPTGAVGLRAVTRDFVLVAHARIAPISVQPFNGGLGKGPCMLSGMSLAQTRTPPERSDNSRGGSQTPRCSPDGDAWLWTQFMHIQGALAYQGATIPRGLAKIRLHRQ